MEMYHRHKNNLIEAKLNSVQLFVTHYPITSGEIASVVKVLHYNRGKFKVRHSVYVFLIK